MEELSRNREAWLGSNGMVAADGGASDGGDILLNPIPNPTQPEDQWYNFCHSSTRFFVEETFGRWKNRFRFLLYRLDCSHKKASRLIYASMILHNFLTVLKDDTVDFSTGADEEWDAFFTRFAPTACPSCVKRKSMHCPHAVRYQSEHRCAKINGSASEQRDTLKTFLWEQLCADGMDETAAEHKEEMQRRMCLD